MGAWTDTPRTWSVAEKLTAALLNAQLRDPLTALGGAWGAYTPSLTGFTAGNGVAVGHFVQFGKRVDFRAAFTLGTTSAAATAYPKLSLPVTAAAAGPALVVGGFSAQGTDFYAATAYLASTTTVQLAIVGTNGEWASPTATSPFTWTDGDAIYVSGTYEAA